MGTQKFPYPPEVEKILRADTWPTQAEITVVKAAVENDQQIIYDPLFMAWLKANAPVIRDVMQIPR